MAQKHKTAAPPRQTQPVTRPPAQPAPTKPKPFLTVLAIASIAVAVLGILLLKQQPSDAVALSSAQAGSPASQASTLTGGNPAAVNGPFKPSSPADQLDQALATGQPALVFMHSNNCQSCIDMMHVVDQVYPEFAEQVVLIDVDVYDAANGPLMETLGLRYIPTVVVFDKAGQGSQNVGGMAADDFRAFLRQRALGG
jgi:thiol:disulfide interchange protein